MTVLSDVLELVAARHAKWVTSVDDILPRPQDLNEYCICGSFSLTAMQTRRRFLVRDALIQTDEGPETPSHLARDYLRVTYQRGPRITSTQAKFIRSTLRNSPAYARPATLRDGWYVDLRAAYWSIMQIVGWDVDYWPGRWVSPGRAPSDFPWPDHKLARNCLVSAGIGGFVTCWMPKAGYYEKQFGNVLANLQLYKLIMDVLHSIAAEMVKAGACYVATDGYILPSFKQMQTAVQIIADWGLTSGIKANGPGVVRGPGAYSIGAHQSRRIVNAPVKQSQVYRPDHAAWLKKHFTQAAARAA